MRYLGKTGGESGATPGHTASRCGQAACGNPTSGTAISSVDAHHRVRHVVGQGEMSEKYLLGRRRHRAQPRLASARIPSPLGRRPRSPQPARGGNPSWKGRVEDHFATASRSRWSPPSGGTDPRSLETMEEPVSLAPRPSIWRGRGGSADPHHPCLLPILVKTQWIPHPPTP